MNFKLEMFSAFYNMLFSLFYCFDKGVHTNTIYSGDPGMQDECNMGDCYSQWVHENMNNL